MLKIGICGISGRMGTAVYRELLRRGHRLAAAFDAPSSSCFGKDAAELLHGEASKVIVSSINDADAARCDGLIDFSAPEAAMALLEAARKSRRPIVMGTTGCSPAQRSRIDESSAEIPILMSPNMSIMVNLLFRITELTARTVGGDCDIEVLEAHHRFKKDAPSGTAKKLVDIIKASVKNLGQADEVHGRSGMIGERRDAEIGVMALRGGDIVGEHTVYFVGTGERLELTHRAISRDNLAAGAVRALEFLAGKKPGMYSMFDVLGI
jgi:4-hydroxy-tetrahydrodipicolinate reductase